MLASKIAVFLLFLPQALAADSSMTFGGASSDLVNHGSDSSIDNLGKFSIVARVYRTGTGGNGITVAKPTFPGGWEVIWGGNSGEIQFVQDLVTDTNYETSVRPLLLNVWTCEAITVSEIGVAPRVHLYAGYSTGTVAEVTTFASNVDGTGVMTDDSAGNLLVGNNSGNALAFVGQIDMVSISSGIMTINQVQEQCWSNVPISTAALFFVLPGQNGTGTQYDLSGKGNNGTVTGATASSNGSASNYRGGAQ